jgi:hypothetical protein
MQAHIHSIQGRSRPLIAEFDLSQWFLPEENIHPAPKKCNEWDWDMEFEFYRHVGGMLNNLSVFLLLHWFLENLYNVLPQQMLIFVQYCIN